MGDGKGTAARKGDSRYPEGGAMVSEAREQGGTLPERTAIARTGHLDGVDGNGRLMFRPEGENGSFPLAIGVGLSDEELVRAAWVGRRALAVVTADEPPRFVLVGLLRERVAAQARDSWPAELEVRLDGETVQLKARKRIELVCGKSRIVLDEQGRIEVNGNYLLSRSRGPVKLKGATVEIN